MGVIDSISEGLNVVRRRPLVMLIPVLVDAVLWLAPRLSIRPLAIRVVSAFSQAAGASQSTDSVQAVGELLGSLGQQSNLLALLANGVVGMPSFLAAGLPEGLWRPFDGIEVSSVAVAGLLAIVFGLIGVGVGTLYLTVVAAAVQGKQLSLRDLLSKAGRNSVRIVSAVLAMMAVLVLVGLPTSLFLSFLAILSPTVGGLVASLVSLIGFWAGLWALFYLFFVIDAMVLQEISLQRSVLNSVMVVRSSFWSVLGLIILLNVLAAGFAVVWHWVATAIPLGTLVAVAGNTFVGSGLVAASFVFYRGRYEALLARISELGRS